jgi:translation initiation factor 2 subunit 3
MPGDETRQIHSDESDSEEEEEEPEPIPVIAVDPTTLTPLSPEVISKQVSTNRYHRLRMQRP